MDNVERKLCVGEENKWFKAEPHLLIQISLGLGHDQGANVNAGVCSGLLRVDLCSV